MGPAGCTETSVTTYLRCLTCQKSEDLMRPREPEVTRRGDSPTPWSRVLPEKLAVPLLVKKFPAFYGTLRFITAFPRARYLFYPKHVNSVYTPSTSWRSILILPSHLRLGIPSDLFPAGGSHQNPVRTSHLPRTYHMPRPSHLDLVTRMVFGGKYRSLSSSFCIASSPWMKATKFRINTRRQTKL